MLCADDARHYYWEIVEAWRKLFLVGIAGGSIIGIEKGSIIQLLMAIAFLLAFNVFKQVLSPYHLIDDGYFAIACDIRCAKQPACGTSTV